MCCSTLTSDPWGGEEHLNLRALTLTSDPWGGEDHALIYGLRGREEFELEHNEQEEYDGVNWKTLIISFGHLNIEMVDFEWLRFIPDALWPPESGFATTFPRLAGRPNKYKCTSKGVDCQFPRHRLVNQSTLARVIRQRAEIQIRKENK
ncbi:hypothetical protein C8J57DRAFT_1213406 [Mycena rebaudengoi]|nr:hypothetical protein C8J57DRAFT_1213406 [Mycena rebaudengoi]